MKNRLEDQPFKNRDQVKAKAIKCALFGDACQYACFILAALGVIGDILNITIGLESMSWFLLAIIAGINAIIGHMNVVLAKNLLDIETENKKGRIELLKW